MDCKKGRLEVTQDVKGNTLAVVSGILWCVAVIAVNTVAADPVKAFLEDYHAKPPRMLQYPSELGPTKFQFEAVLSLGRNSSGQVNELIVTVEVDGDRAALLVASQSGRVYAYVGPNEAYFASPASGCVVKIPQVKFRFVLPDSSLSPKLGLSSAIKSSSIKVDLDEKVQTLLKAVSIHRNYSSTNAAYQSTSVTDTRVSILASRETGLDAYPLESFEILTAEGKGFKIQNVRLGRRVEKYLLDSKRFVEDQGLIGSISECKNQEVLESHAPIQNIDSIKKWFNNEEAAGAAGLLATALLKANRQERDSLHSLLEGVQKATSEKNCCIDAELYESQLAQLCRTCNALCHKTYYYCGNSKIAAAGESNATKRTRLIRTYGTQVTRDIEQTLLKISQNRNLKSAARISAYRCVGLFGIQPTRPLIIPGGESSAVKVNSCLSTAYSVRIRKAIQEEVSRMVRYMNSQDVPLPVRLLCLESVLLARSDQLEISYLEETIRRGVDERLSILVDRCFLAMPSSSIGREWLMDDIRKEKPLITKSLAYALLSGSVLGAERHEPNARALRCYVQEEALRRDLEPQERTAAAELAFSLSTERDLAFEKDFLRAMLNSGDVRLQIYGIEKCVVGNTDVAAVLDVALGRYSKIEVRSRRMLLGAMIASLPREVSNSERRLVEELIIQARKDTDLVCQELARGLQIRLIAGTKELQPL